MQCHIEYTRNSIYVLYVFLSLLGKVFEVVHIHTYINSFIAEADDKFFIIIKYTSITKFC